MLRAEALDQRGGAIAVTDGENTMSYAQLAGRATAIVHALEDGSVRPGDRVGIGIRRPGFDDVVATLGCLLASVTQTRFGQQTARDQHSALLAAIIRTETASNRGPAITRNDSGLHVELDNEGFLLACLGANEQPAQAGDALVAAIISDMMHDSNEQPRVHLHWTDLAAYGAQAVEQLGMTEADRVAVIHPSGSRAGLVTLCAALSCGATLCLPQARRTTRRATWQNAIEDVAEQATREVRKSKRNTPSGPLLFCAKWGEYKLDWTLYHIAASEKQ